MKYTYIVHVVKSKLSMVLLNKVELNSKKFYFSSAIHDEGGFCFNNKRFFMWLVTYIEKSLFFTEIFLQGFSAYSIDLLLHWVTL